MALKTLRYHNLVTRQSGIRSFHQNLSISHVALAEESHDRISIEDFRHRAFETKTPLCMKAAKEGSKTRSLPTISKWFQLSKGDVMRPSWPDFSFTPLPYELLHPRQHPDGGEAFRLFIEHLKSSESELATWLGEHLDAQIPDQELPEEQRLLRFNAPFALILAAHDFNRRIGIEARGKSSPELPLGNIYVAQAPINDLPEQLQNDLPVSNIVKTAGRGDIYDSSIWLGLEPTYTPLHRDPNPNLFVQLRSIKVVRLLSPASGDLLFHQLKQQLGVRSGNSRIRGDEMMQGLEREAFYTAIWAPKEGQPVSQPGDEVSKLPMQEAILHPGDALYIPKGWWHSVRSLFSDGRLNGSVNWWFR